MPTENIIAVDSPQNQQHPTDLLWWAVREVKACNIVTFGRTSTPEESDGVFGRHNTRLHRFVALNRHSLDYRTLGKFNALTGFGNRN